MIRLPKPLILPEPRLPLPIGRPRFPGQQPWNPFLHKRRMTLIAAFRGDSGIAICADSQETVGEYKRAVQKIEPLVIGNYQVAIAGGGVSTLIESFIVLAERAIRRLDSTPSTPSSPVGISALRKAIERTLLNFYKKDVPLCPETDKHIKLFIAAACPITQEYAMWVSENARLRDADTLELNGWEEKLYKETANRMAAPILTIPQAVLASIYTITIAANTSLYVNDKFSVAIVDKNGIHMEDEKYIRKMQDRLNAYESQVNRLFLACADTTPL